MKHNISGFINYVHHSLSYRIGFKVDEKDRFLGLVSKSLSFISIKLQDTEAMGGLESESWAQQEK